MADTDINEKESYEEFERGQNRLKYQPIILHPKEEREEQRKQERMTSAEYQKTIGEKPKQEVWTAQQYQDYLKNKENIKYQKQVEATQKSEKKSKESKPSYGRKVGASQYEKDISKGYTPSEARKMAEIREDIPKKVYVPIVEPRTVEERQAFFALPKSEQAKRFYERRPDVQKLRDIEKQTAKDTVEYTKALAIAAIKDKKLSRDRMEKIIVSKSIKAQLAKIVPAKKVQKQLINPLGYSRPAQKSVQPVQKRQVIPEPRQTSRAAAPIIGGQNPFGLNAHGTTVAPKRKISSQPKFDLWGHSPLISPQQRSAEPHKPSSNNDFLGLGSFNAPAPKSQIMQNKKGKKSNFLGLESYF